MKELIAAINRANAQQKLSLLPQALKYGDSGIDFLIESLKDQELFVREKAYQLLGKVGSEKAKQAISPGLLLNPGDKIYSVYAASKWFTDTVYVLSNNVDYLTDIYSEVYGYLEKYGRNYYDEEELRQRSKIIFCYVNPEQAAQKAEFLHRQAIQKLRVGIGGFEWEQENPDFDIKQWYLAHNLPYQDEWNDLGEYSIRWKMESAVWESGDTTLRD